LPPALNIPRPVGDLCVYQRHDQMLIEFTMPELTTEDLALKRPAVVDLRGGAAPAAPFNADQWAAVAMMVPAPPDAEGVVRVQAPSKQWQGTEAIFGVRIGGPKGRFSPWSNFVVLNVVPPLPRAENLTAHSTGKGVQLNWRVAEARPGLAWRVLRRGPADEAPVEIGRAASTTWLDAQAAYDATYDYSVLTVWSAGAAEAQSLPGEAVTITPRDTFPPAVPTGLAGLVGTGSIELTWDRNGEGDLRGYRVYRGAEGGPWQLIGDEVSAPAFSDKQVEAAKRYSYAVTALDEKGNESARSQVVEVRAP
jgi:hypothetical protein